MQLNCSLYNETALHSRPKREFRSRPRRSKERAGRMRQHGIDENYEHSSQSCRILPDKPPVDIENAKIRRGLRAKLAKAAVRSGRGAGHEF